MQARFRELAADHSDQEVMERLTAELAGVLQDGSGPDAGVFWLALADARQRAGRLHEEVRRQAVRVVEDGSELRRWPEELREERRRVLEALVARLGEPVPEPEPLAEPLRHANEWGPGQIVAYRRRSGRSVPFRVLGSYSDDGVWMDPWDLPRGVLRLDPHTAQVATALLDEPATCLHPASLLLRIVDDDVKGRWEDDLERRFGF